MWRRPRSHPPHANDTPPAHTATLRHDAKESTGDFLRTKERVHSASLFELKVSDQTRHEPPETLCMHQRLAARHAWKSRVHPASSVECLLLHNIIASQGLAAPQTLHNNHLNDQRHQRPTVFFSAPSPPLSIGKTGMKHAACRQQLRHVNFPSHRPTNFLSHTSLIHIVLQATTS